MGVKLWRL